LRAVCAASLPNPGACHVRQNLQGKAKTGYWVLEYDPETPRRIDPLMGYTSSGDTKSQIRLTFQTQEEAVAYAEKHGIEYRVQEPKESRRRQISYSDNFRYERKTPWTH
jgi:hypothetical protein